MTLVYDIWEFIKPFFQIGFQVLDYILVGIIVLWAYRLTKGTSAIPVFIGLFAIYIIWKLVDLLGMPILSELLGQFIGVGILAIIIVFQQELRQFLFSIGDRANIKRPTQWMEKLMTIRHEQKEPLKISEITRAVKRLSARKEGALIILQRHSDLSIHFQGNTPLVADIYAPLIESCFHKESSMHDGGMYIAIGRIRAVQCVLPVSQNPKISQELGMRHRAALGLVEKTDALVLVVSEETGLISIAMEGELHRGLSPDDIQEILYSELVKEAE